MKVISVPKAFLAEYKKHDPQATDAMIRKFLNDVMRSIETVAAREGKVVFANFGTFFEKKINERTYANLQDRTKKVTVPAHKKLIFKPAKTTMKTAKTAKSAK